MSGIVSPLFFIGVVEDRQDPRKEGRIKVRAFGFHGTNAEIDTQDLPWATLIVDSPNFVPPPLNAWVMGMFADGRDAQQPFIFGLIPTQMANLVDPATNGYGSFATDNYSLNAMGHRPQDVGQPMLPASARGEYALDNVMVAQEVNRVEDLPIAGSDEKWSEPGSAYAPQYPYNHVQETAAGHAIHLDDTPGAERVMVYHRSGSFVQIDANGNTVIKSSADSANITEGNSRTFVGSNGGGAQHIVTIMGDSKVYIDGNKTEEVRGDLKQIVHGNYILDVAGDAAFNVSDRIQMRAARLAFEANVENITLKAARELKQTAGFAAKLVAPSISSEAANIHSTKANGIVLSAAGEAAVRASTIRMGSGGGFHVAASESRLGGPVHIQGPLLSPLPSGGGAAPDSPSLSPEALGSDLGGSVELPEPTSKSVVMSDLAPMASTQSVSYGGRDDIIQSDYNADYTGASFDTGVATPIGTPASVTSLYEMLREAGLDHNKAVGALVNIKRESSFNPAAVGDNGDSLGLFQFNVPSGRGKNLVAYVPDWRNNPKGQIFFMFRQDPQGVSYAKRNFTSALEAANWFTNRVEIPAARAAYTSPGGYNAVNLPTITNLVGSKEA